MSDEEKLKMTPYSILNDGKNPILIQIETILEEIKFIRV